MDKGVREEGGSGPSPEGGHSPVTGSQGLAVIVGVANTDCIGMIDTVRIKLNNRIELL